MSVTRRRFLATLASAFGVASVMDLTRLVQDGGKPILLRPMAAARTLHVYENGVLTLGPWTAEWSHPRPTWREVLLQEGFDPADADTFAKEVAYRFEDPSTLEEAVDDRCWPGVYSALYDPSASAHRLLRSLNVGTSLRGKGGLAGRLDFHEGDNHPGSWDIWVEAHDDLTVSLLQARLIELRQPIQVIMEVPHVVRLEDA